MSDSVVSRAEQVRLLLTGIADELQFQPPADGHERAGLLAELVGCIARVQPRAEPRNLSPSGDGTLSNQPEPGCHRAETLRCGQR